LIVFFAGVSSSVGVFAIVAFTRRKDRAISASVRRRSSSVTLDFATFDQLRGFWRF